MAFARVSEFALLGNEDEDRLTSFSPARAGASDAFPDTHSYDADRRCSFPYDNVRCWRGIPFVNGRTASDQCSGRA